MTFDEWLIDYDVTLDERMALVWHLALFRARSTVERLSDDASYQQMRKNLLSVLRDKA